MFTGEEMQRGAHLAITSRELYRLPPNREPAPFGVLDPRLGISGKSDGCGTCGRNLSECPGHWGYIPLELPVFHIGFLKATITLLQNICKVCSRVLLKPDERKGLLKAMRDPRTDSLKRTRLRRKITEITKKAPMCPWCGALNGSVKKVNAATCFRILHDRFKLAKGDAKEEAKESFFSVVAQAAGALSMGGAGGLDTGLVGHAKQRAMEELTAL